MAWNCAENGRRREGRKKAWLMVVLRKFRTTGDFGKLRGRGREAIDGTNTKYVMGREGQFSGKVADGSPPPSFPPFFRAILLSLPLYNQFHSIWLGKALSFWELQVKRKSICIRRMYLEAKKREKLFRLIPVWGKRCGSNWEENAGTFVDWMKGHRFNSVRNSPPATSFP